MICKHTNRKSERCGLPEEAIIHMDGWIGGHIFEPSVPIAKLQPAVEPWPEWTSPSKELEKELNKKYEAGSTRPETPPHEPVAYRDHSDAWIQCSCGWGSFGTDGDEWLEHVKSLTIPAASVQQEPLNCHRCFEVSNQVLEHVNVLENANDSEEYYSAAFELRKILPSLDQFIKLEIEDALKAAAPRTQGRELPSKEQLAQVMFGRHFGVAKSWDTSLSQQVWIDKAESALNAIVDCAPAARPEITELFSILKIYGRHKDGCYKNPTTSECACGWEAVSNDVGRLKQFFTALPEAPKEN